MIGIDEALPQFSLENVLGETISLKDLTKKPVILLFSTQKFVKSLDEWYQRLANGFSADEINIVPIGVLNKLPSFVPSSAIKVRLKKETKAPILMDMKGEVAKQFQITEDGAYIIVADKSHTVRKAEMELSDSLLDDIQKLAK